jgi:hypothetical protein
VALLKHCPFCGYALQRAQIEKDQDGRRVAFVLCDTCRARGTGVWDTGKETDEQLRVKATAAWNRWHERTHP